MQFAKPISAIASLGLLVLAPLAAAQPPVSPKTPNTDCAPNYYRLADGSGVDIAPAQEGKYRWRRPDGTTGLLSPAQAGSWSSTLGWTGRSDGITVDLSGCSRGEIDFAGVTGRRLDFDTREIKFASGNAQLAGRLILPVGQGAVPVVVLVHGSEDSSALRTYALQRLLPAQGIGVFVYDKRGTGRAYRLLRHQPGRLDGAAGGDAQPGRFRDRRLWPRGIAHGGG